jgi:hypothetical protein
MISNHVASIDAYQSFRVRPGGVTEWEREEYQKADGVPNDYTRYAYIAADISTDHGYALQNPLRGHILPRRLWQRRLALLQLGEYVALQFVMCLN